MGARGCKYIGWVVEDQKCACMNIRMKLEQQNLKLKLYLAISWFLFVSVLVYKVGLADSKHNSDQLAVFVLALDELNKVSFTVSMPHSRSRSISGMSISDNYGLPRSFGTSFPLEDDVPWLDRGSHTSLPPPPPIILLNPQVQTLEKFKVTQALLAMKHEDGRHVCTHVLEMKSHIDRLRVLGVKVSRKLASYSEFIKDYYVTDHYMTLVDLTYLLVVAESAMIWRTGKANSIRRSTPQTSMDIDDGNIGSPEKISLSKEKRNTKSEIIPCAIPKESICFYCQEKAHWLRSCPNYLKDLRKGRIEKFEFASGCILMFCTIMQNEGSLKEEYVEYGREDGFQWHGSKDRIFELLLRCYDRLCLNLANKERFSSPKFQLEKNLES
uniref:CCHC-type domain-containing protein n=1 Tax=Lactuca sativa TaxID=4236 RepID=A0A9R1UD54_LACSA|nr:hypothetical protein LSAT_V11C900464860 [Lactuca sativa]